MPLPYGGVAKKCHSERAPASRRLPRLFEGDPSLRSGRQAFCGASGNSKGGILRDAAFLSGYVIVERFLLPLATFDQ